MENDIYRQIIHELSNKSEKDFGFKRVEGGKARLSLYVMRGIYLLLQLVIIITISVLLARQYGGIQGLTINLYIVAVSIAILGVLNYPSIWKKFTRKLIIIVMMIVSALVALKITVPDNVIPLVDNQLPFWVSWGIIVTIISFVIYLISHTVVSLTELLLDLASVFLPVLPATFGRSLPDLTSETYKILSRETAEKETAENNLKFLISASQADIDSAGIRSLPWVVILGLGAASFSETFKGIDSFLSPANLLLGFPLLLIGLVAIFNIARMTYFQTLIIQVANRLLIDLPKADHERQEKHNSLMILTENNKPGCLLKILFPWKNSG